MLHTDLAGVYRDYIACLNERDWPKLERFVADDVHYNGQRIGHVDATPSSDTCAAIEWLSSATRTGRTDAPSFVYAALGA